MSSDLVSDSCKPSEVGKDGQTSPFQSCWCVYLPPSGRTWVFSWKGGSHWPGVYYSFVLWVCFHFWITSRVSCLYNSGHSHRGDLWTGLQQRAAQAAGQASVDGGQVTVGGACWPNARQSPHREVQRRTQCSALRQGRQTQPHRPISREKVSWVWNQRSPGMVEEMSGLDGTL